MTETLTPEAFITAWQTAADPKDVEAKTGLTYKAAYQRARGYRKKGVPLKRFEAKHEGYNWDSLAKLAVDLLTKETTDGAIVSEEL